MGEKLRLRSVQRRDLEPADAPSEELAAEEEPKWTPIRVIQVFAVVALFSYGGGVVYSHLLYSQYDRAACYRAGGILGRIWCPETVETEGFRVHFVKALGWPAQIVRTAATPADKFEETVAAAKRGSDAAATQQRTEDARHSVREVQRLLNTLGYKIGSVDGVVGQRTHAAITDFQLRDGMQVSGEVTAELIARLKNEVRRIKVDAVESQ